MSHDEISYKEIYELIDSRFNKLENVLGARIEKVEREQQKLKDWKNNFIGKIAVIGFGVAIGIQLLLAIVVDIIKQKLNY